MKYKNNFEYDLQIGQTKERELGDIFNSKTVEVKYDFKALRSRNVYVEYQNKGKPSGLSVSTADFYCFCFGETFHLIHTNILKDKCRKYLGTRRDKFGGDNNTSKGILLPIVELF